MDSTPAGAPKVDSLHCLEVGGKWSCSFGCEGKTPVWRKQWRTLSASLHASKQRLVLKSSMGEPLPYLISLYER